MIRPIWKAIKQYRATREMTQEKFAELFGCSLRTLARWESGETKPSNVWHTKLKRKGVCE
jgi:DNA-binding transcriptional regulator YiaG